MATSNRRYRELVAIEHGSTHMILALQELLGGVLEHDQILRASCNNFGVKHERVIGLIEDMVNADIRRLRRERRKAKAELGHL